MYTVNMDI